MGMVDEVLEGVMVDETWTDAIGPDVWNSTWADWNALVPTDVMRLVLSKLSLEAFSRMRAVSRVWKDASERFETEEVEVVKMRLQIAQSKEEAERMLANRRRPLRNRCCVCDCYAFRRELRHTSCCSCCPRGCSSLCSSVLGLLCCPCICLYWTIRGYR